jgi:hypothetical protein
VRTTTDTERASLGFAASGALHALFLLLLLASATLPRAPVSAPDPGIAVEIVPDDARPAARPPEPPPEPIPPPPAPQAGHVLALPVPDRSPPRPPVPAAPARTDLPKNWVRATQMLSPARLADPRSRAALQHLAALPADMRDEQLCGFEAMEQIGRALKVMPDQVVAYAFADTHAENGVLAADGAAYRAKGRWYHLTFRCRVSPARPVVEAFEFATGGPIPKRDWNEHGLGDGDGDD